MLRFSFIGSDDIAATRLEPVDLGEEILVLLRLPPLLVPIQPFAVLASSAPFGSSFEDELGNILAWRTLSASICKVLDDSRATLAHRPKIEGVSTRIESKYHVELLDQD